MIQDPNPKPLKIQHHMKPAMGSYISAGTRPAASSYSFVFPINISLYLADTSEDPYRYDSHPFRRGGV